MEMTPASSRILAMLLEARTGQELPPSRQWRIGTALSGVLRDAGMASLDELISTLTVSRETALSRKVIEALLNNETYFFRDKSVFDQLSQRILPDIAERRAASRTLSIWSAGCSTGQEALSLAMLLTEQESRWADWTIDILGTDVSGTVIEVARKGCYSQFEIQRGLGVTQMIRWFDETDAGWQAQERIRNKVRFGVHNLLDQPPALGRFDIVLCRNVMLYFDAANRVRAFDRLASAMSPDGWLMLGAGETVVGQTERFAPERSFVGFYRPVESKAGDQPVSRGYVSARSAN
jgi:chemotaxis protein methyltransferase CheR